MRPVESKTLVRLLLLAAVVLFTFLGSRGLDEPDEGRYAEIGREMAVTGQWLVPHLNGFEHFQKPPLLYWATASAISLFGANEWAARLPSALAALGTVALTWWLARALFGVRAGIFAGLILLSCVGFFVMGRVLTPDMFLTFWITAAIASLLRQTQAPAGRRQRWAYLFFLVLGLGFLTKGPMALVVPISAALAWQWGSRATGRSLFLPWGRGLLLTLAISLSWFVVLSVWRNDLFRYFWHDELVQRFGSSHHGRHKPVWFFLPVLVVATMPWFFFVPGLLQRTWLAWRAGRVSAGSWLLLGWVVPPLIILSLSGSKLPTYILPLLPAVAIALAHYLSVEKRSASVWVPRLALATLGVSLVGAATLPGLNDRLGQQASLRDLLRPIAAEAKYREARVYAVGVRCHGLDFYLRRLVAVTREQADLVLVPTPEQEKRLLTTEKFDARTLEPVKPHPPVLVVTRRDRAASEFPGETWEPLGHAGDFVLLHYRHDEPRLAREAP